MTSESTKTAQELGKLARLPNTLPSGVEARVGKVDFKRGLPSQRLAWMSQEEPQHLLGRVGSLRVCVRPAKATARPSMSSAMQDPMLGHDTPLGVLVDVPSKLPPVLAAPRL